MFFLWFLKKKSQQAKTGLDPEVLFSDSRATQRYFTALSRIMTGAIVLQILLHAVGIIALAEFYPFGYLTASWMNHLGLGIALLGLSFCLSAQITMGTSWRVGIDTKNQSALITHTAYLVLFEIRHTPVFSSCVSEYF